MQELRLVAANERGTHLVLRSPDGDKFLLCVDERLRAAARGDRSRFANEGENAAELRPREIQARIRSGASAEQVARSAGVPVDRVRRFEGPVLAEREHIAGLAQRSTVRRHGLDARPAALLEVLTDRLTPLGVDPEELGWDSWRRDDGRWVVQVAYSLDEATVVARYLYDPRARSVLPEDDEARWLTGEISHRTPTEGLPIEPDELAPTEAPERPSALRKSLNGRQERPASVAAISSVGELMESPFLGDPTTGEKATPAPAAIAAAMRSAAAAAECSAEPVTPRRPVEARRPAVPQRRPAVAMDVQLPVAFPEPVTPAPTAAAPPAPEPAPPAVESEPETETVVARTGTDGEPARNPRSRRASVPAWDEIVFGARRSD